MIPDIILEAKDASPKQFQEIIVRAHSILNYERSGKAVRPYKIVGGLVELPPKGHVIILGDIHGDIDSLDYILTNSLSQPSFKDTTLIFLGDYGDRGPYSPLVWYVILALKVHNPNSVLLLRGNHEGPPDLLPFPHDMPTYFTDRFTTKGAALYKQIITLFPYLYHTILVRDKYFMVHGGLPSTAKTIEDIINADLHHPSSPHLEEILWSDPKDNIQGTSPSPRGAGNLFGEDVTDRILKMLNARLVIRGHEPCSQGVEAVHNGKILTIFSRVGSPYYNMKGAYLKVDLKSPVLDSYKLAESAISFPSEMTTFK